MLVSASGITPGINLGSFVLPLNLDVLFMFSVTGPNLAPFYNTLGVLNSSGRATATFALTPLSIGGTLNLHLAYVAWDSTSWTWTSNAVPLTIER